MGLKPVFDLLSPDQKVQFDLELENSWNEKFGPDTKDMLSFEVLVVVAIK